MTSLYRQNVTQLYLIRMQIRFCCLIS